MDKLLEQKMNALSKESPYSYLENSKVEQIDVIACSLGRMFIRVMIRIDTL